MKQNPRQLRTHLLITVLIKLAALVLIWWFFVRGEAVDINAEVAASHMRIPVISQGVSK